MRRAWLAFGLVVLATLVWVEGCAADGETSAFDDDGPPPGSGGNGTGNTEMR